MEYNAAEAKYHDKQFRPEPTTESEPACIVMQNNMLIEEEKEAEEENMLTEKLVGTLFEGADMSDFDDALYECGNNFAWDVPKHRIDMAPEEASKWLLEKVEQQHKEEKPMMVRGKEGAVKVPTFPDSNPYS